MVPQPLKQLLRQLQPSSLKELRLQRKLTALHRTFSPLTLEQTFTKIYNGNYWGGKPGEFYSGSGSDDAFTEQYCELIRAFVARQKLKTVVDLGCGDFRVGEKLCSPAITYVGVDIVASLIEHLSAARGSATVTFQCLNIVENTPPDGDLCLIRQVLQHFSNAEIAQVLNNARKYRYVIVSEHIPVAPDQANLDKSHGPDIRLYKKSGVFLDEPPFSLGVETLLDVPAGRDEVIRTVLIRNPASR